MHTVASYLATLFLQTRSYSYTISLTGLNILQAVYYLLAIASK